MNETEDMAFIDYWNAVDRELLRKRFAIDSLDAAIFTKRTGRQHEAPTSGSSASYPSRTARYALRTQKSEIKSGNDLTGHSNCSTLVGVRSKSHVNSRKPYASPSASTMVCRSSSDTRPDHRAVRIDKEN